MGQASFPYSFAFIAFDCCISKYAEYFDRLRKSSLQSQKGSKSFRIFDFIEKKVRLSQTIKILSVLGNTTIKSNKSKRIGKRRLAHFYSLSLPSL